MINPNRSTIGTELQDLPKDISRGATSYIISKLWRLATVDPRQTDGKTGAQKHAFKLLLDIQGGVEFLTGRPKTELTALGQDGICSANLHVILRELARLELGRRRGLIDAREFRQQVTNLLRDAKATL